MKKLLLAACLVFAATTISLAQGGQGRQRKTPDESAKLLQSQLKLTDDQTAKAKDIYTVQSTKIDSLIKVANGDFSNMRGVMRPLMEATNAKITALLTDEQKVAWKKVQEEQAARRGQRGGGPNGQAVGTPPPTE